jgi:hypothetical protein
MWFLDIEFRTFGRAVLTAEPSFQPQHMFLSDGINSLAPCLVGVSIPAQNIMTKKLGRKGFIQLILPHYCSSPKEVRTGTYLGAGADAEAMEGCYLLACFPSIVQLAFEPRTTSPGMAPPTMGWALLLLIEKMPYSWISWRHFIKGSSFLCNNSSWCQVVTQTQQVHPVSF